MIVRQFPSLLLLDGYGLYHWREWCFSGVVGGLSIGQYSPRHSSEVHFERETMMYFPGVFF